MLTLVCRWSFGGNRLQIKAETRILSDVAAALEAVSNIGARAGNPLRSLQPKEQLLQALISNEHMRLTVWLNPLDHGGYHAGPGQGLRHYSDVSMKPTLYPALLRLNKDLVATMARVAWEENPAIAIHMTARYQSHSVIQAVRRLLLAEPEKAMGEADAAHTLLGSSLAIDVNSQLKVRNCT